MDKMIYTTIILILLVSCQKYDNVAEEKFNEAVVNSDTIYSVEIDSLIRDYVYDLKISAINQSINERLLKKEAIKSRLSVDELLMNIDGSYYKDKEDEYLKYYLDSLRTKIKIEILLMPDYLKSIETSNLIYNTIIEVGKHNVYVISDFKCPQCQKLKHQIDSIIEANPTVNFYYIYHSDYIDKTIQFAHACGLQGKFYECYHWLYEHRNAFLDYTDYLQFAFDNGLDMELLEQNMNDDDILKDFVINKRLLIENGVNRVPCFIVHNKLLIDGDPINYLQKVIDHEFYK